MRRTTPFLRFSTVIVAGLLGMTTLGCASPYRGSPGTGIPEAAAELIANRYSSDPSLQRAAEGFAANLIHQWRAAVITGVYDDGLSRSAGNGQMCWTARVERVLNRTVTERELIEFMGALTSTRELLSASKKSNSLQDGHPLLLSTSEEAACRKASID